MSAATRVQRCGSSSSVRLSSAEDDRELLVVGRLGRRRGAGGLELDALVDEQRGVAAVVEDHVRPALGPRQRLLGAPPVLLERLALPGEDGDAGGGDRGGGVVLRGEDVARAPAHVGAERGQRLDQHGGLDRHVQRARDPRAPERLGVAELLAQRHQAGHLVLGELDLLAAVVGEADVGHLVVGRGRRHRVSIRVVGRWAAATASSFECFSCSQRSQSGAGTCSGRSAVASSQPSTAPRSSRPRAAAPGEGDVGQPQLVPLEQLAQRAQALQLGRAVEAVARAGARRLDQPDALDVAQHARRPAGRLCGLVDRQGVHRTPA